jgi:hypothetical protein
MKRRLFLMALTTALAAAARADVRLIVDRNLGPAATPAYTFKRVPPPSADDAATHAVVALIAGRIDGNSTGLPLIHDGRVAGNEDEPASNLFFAAGTWGGRFRMDLGAMTLIAQINSYSWHPNSRAAQLYKVYGSDGTDPNFNPAPGSKIDPTTCGWKLIAFVDTRPQEGETGGQYGVSITGTSGIVGHVRYLLFDCFETEGDDDWSNTFYSEIDVVAVRNGARAVELTRPQK